MPDNPVETMFELYKKDTSTQYMAGQREKSAFVHGICAAFAVMQKDIALTTVEDKITGAQSKLEDAIDEVLGSITLDS
jgi:hypothetical protein